MPLIPTGAETGRSPSTTDVLRHLPFGPRLVTSAFVALLANATAPRPRPFTLAGDYTSWISLTDRSFTGRHLPPCTAGSAAAHRGRGARAVPPAAGGETPSADTSVLFLLFAQWFTDSFLRTDHTDWRKNTSTQEIDFCQIYGLSEPKTRLLRVDGGRPAEVAADRRRRSTRRSCSSGRPAARYAIKPEFKGLHDEDWLLDVLLAGVVRPAEGPVLRRRASSTATPPPAAPPSTSSSCASTTGSPGCWPRSTSAAGSARPGTGG